MLNRVLIASLRPFGRSLRAVLGARRYRALRLFIKPSRRFDEVSIVWRSIGQARSHRGVMLDVGCHHGESAEAFAESGWEVHCFEPNSANWPIIEKRVTARFPKAQLHRVAVGERAQEKQLFYTSTESSGISSLHPFHESHRPSAAVDVITLAGHCKANKIGRVDFLKIDTEGFDYFVLRGFPWDTVRPDVVVCEFEDSKTIALGYTYVDMASFLIDRGYYVIISEWEPVEKYGIAHKWLRYTEFPGELQNPDGWGNLIAVSPGPTQEHVLQTLSLLSPCARFLRTSFA